MALELSFHPLQKGIYEDPRRFKVISCGRRFGKALDIQTPVPSPSGWVTIGDVEPGDYVFAADGTQTEVDWVSEIRTDRPCYRITFSDGSEIVADEDHQWVVEDKKYRKNSARCKHRRHVPPTVTTGDMFMDYDCNRADGRREWNYAIPTGAPIQYNTETLPVAPYAFGAWLGDGHSRGGQITTADPEILDEFARYGYTNVARSEYTYTIYSSELHTEGSWKGTYKTLGMSLRDMGVLQNKHIPRIYLESDIEQRLALLQGLMDTDGTITSLGHCEFTSTNETLAYDALELILSLGIKATMSIGIAKLYGRPISEKYRIKFTTSLDVFRLPRKRARQKATHKSDINRRFIINIEPIQPVPVKCIHVKHPSHLFLVGRTFIPTHNSVMASQAAIIKGLERKDGEIILVSPTFSQTQIIYNMIMRRLPERYIRSKSVAEKYVELISGTRIYAKSGDNPDSMRGYGPFLAILDEAAMLKEEVWKEVLRPALADNKGDAIIISTPKGKNWFYEMFEMGLSDDPKYADYAAFKYSSYDNPFLDPKELDEMAANLPQVVYDQEILAEFIEGGGVVFRTFTDVLRDCLEEPVDGEAYVGGADLGRREDFTVITIYKRRTGEIVYLERFNRLDWDYIKARIRSVSVQYNGATMFIDSTGMGDPIYEDLAKQGVNVRGVKISSKSKGDMINALAIMIENKEIWLPNDNELKKEFQAYTYTLTPEGNVKYGAPPGRHDDIVISIALIAYGTRCYTGCVGMVEPDKEVEESHYWDEEDENFIDWEEDVETLDAPKEEKWRPRGLSRIHLED